MYFKFIKLIVLLSLLVCCGFAGRVLYGRFPQLCRTRERSTSQKVIMCKESMQYEIINNKKKPPARLFFYRNPDEKHLSFFTWLQCSCLCSATCHCAAHVSWGGRTFFCRLMTNLKCRRAKAYALFIRLQLIIKSSERLLKKDVVFLRSVSIFHYFELKTVKSGSDRQPVFSVAPMAFIQRLVENSARVLI